MALQTNDFLLTQDQLDRINAYFQGASKAYATAGSDPATEVSVVFTWAAPFGRSVSAHYDCAVVGIDIEDATGPLSDPSSGNR